MPLSIPTSFSYIVPDEYKASIQLGVRVEVPIKQKLYAGIVVEIHDEAPGEFKMKPIRSVIDSEPIIHMYQYRLWKWIASYYCAAIGDVMQVALPSVLKLSSETKIVSIASHLDVELSDDEYVVAEAVSIHNELTVDEIKDILDRKTVYPIIRSLIDKQLISIKEELIEKYKPKFVSYIRLSEAFIDKYDEARELVERSKHQTNALDAYIQLSKKKSDVPRKAIYEMAMVGSTVIRALVKKGIFVEEKKEVSRIEYVASHSSLPPLSAEQERAMKEIHASYEDHVPVLLQGVTGSGKTRVYMELIQEAIDAGKQVLYLVPEIALTTQLVGRIQEIFGKEVGWFHSRMSNHERAELWSDVLIGKKIVVGARSSLFLPFTNLGLIIVDEEHDPSYKQHDPSPRYHARDTAVVLAKMQKAQIIMGSATPALESQLNVHLEKYNLVQMTQRYGDVKLPKFSIVDLKRAYKTNRMKEMFSLALLDSLKETLSRGEQAIVFQNRRGYAPVVSCDRCGWRSECRNCDVTLTYHKYLNECKCHYCHYRVKKPMQCPQCGHDDIVDSGHGTEKIVEALEGLLPEAKLGRLDYESTRSKSAFETILGEFAAGEIDILVGTQMVSKGLDFDNIGLVAIINADSIYRFPDFRADERGYQMMVQVAGRAGRKKKQGQVVLQTFTPEHPIISEVIHYAYPQHIRRVLQERKDFVFPPYCKLISLEVTHRTETTAEQAATYLYGILQREFGNRVSSPFVPTIARLKGNYYRCMTIKLERNAQTIRGLKTYLVQCVERIKKTPGIKSARVKIVVDPY